MKGPGYEPVSVTGQVASGANIVGITTGRGSGFGFKPTPSIKIASNTNMYNKLREEMDINAGTIMDNEKSLEEVGEEILKKIMAVASGEKSKSEIKGYGDDEYNPRMINPTI
jgi:Altronate dehydratase